jgi:hypothetical protein
MKYKYRNFELGICRCASNDTQQISAVGNKWGTHFLRTLNFTNEDSYSFQSGPETKQQSLQLGRAKLSGQQTHLQKKYILN